MGIPFVLLLLGVPIALAAWDLMSTSEATA